MDGYYLAVDIGASSGRSILAWMENDKLRLEELNRFNNHMIQKNGHLVWDIESLKTGILEGLRTSARINRVPKSIGIDTWGVDYVLLDNNGKVIGDPVSYRDSRTRDIRKEVEAVISDAELYSRTGIQYQPFNTIYQLAALKNEHTDQLEGAEHLLMLPDYFNYWLTGVMKQEYTNATTSNLVNARSHEWDRYIIQKLGFPDRIFSKLSMPGTVVGNLRPEIQKEVGFDSVVVLPATHDTGSAFLSVPCNSTNSVILSSGTWSLLGIENSFPITTEASMEKNFTNEGGAWYRYRYLKNIMGLWMIQSVRRELNDASYFGRGENQPVNNENGSVPHSSRILAGASDHTKWEFSDLIDEARKAECFSSEVDVNDNRFLAPENMISEVQEACRESGQPVPMSVGEIMQCLYRSLASCYKTAIHELSCITGTEYNEINIIGGGCQDKYLNNMTAKKTGLPVHAGPVEGTAIGNIIVQMIASGRLKDLNEAKKALRDSFRIQGYGINNIEGMQ